MTKIELSSLDMSAIRVALRYWLKQDPADPDAASALEKIDDKFGPATLVFTAMHKQGGETKR